MSNAKVNQKQSSNDALCFILQVLYSGCQTVSCVNSTVWADNQS